MKQESRFSKFPFLDIGTFLKTNLHALPDTLHRVQYQKCTTKC